MTVENDPPSPKSSGAGQSGVLSALGSPAGRLVWVLVAAAGIIGGVYLVSGIEPAGTKPESAIPSQPAGTPAATPADSVIAPDNLPGFDTGQLTDKQRLWLYHKANLEPCSCDCGMTVAQCRVEDPTCPVSPGRALEMVEEAVKRDG